MEVNDTPTSRTRRHSDGPGSESPTTLEPPCKHTKASDPLLEEQEHPSLPLRRLIDVTGWLSHTLGLETTRKLPLTVDTRRSILEKLEDLNSITATISASNISLQARLDEARRVPTNITKCFTQALANRDASYDVRLADYIAVHFPQLQHPQVDQATIEERDLASRNPSAFDNTYANKVGARSSRVDKQMVSPQGAPKSQRQKSATARSKSRATKNASKIASGKGAQPPPAFIITPSAEKSAAQCKDSIWKEVTRATKAPKIIAISGATGKVVLKPQNKESTDILKALSSRGLIKEDLPKRPRIIIRGLPATFSAPELVEAIFDQNPDLNLPDGARLEHISPVFKREARDRETISWTFEVSPEAYTKLEDKPLFVGFMSCRAAKFEEVTQCFGCLRFGHTASKCNSSNSDLSSQT